MGAVKATKAFALLGISRATGYQWIKEGKLETVRIGARLLVPIASLQKLLAIK